MVETKSRRERNVLRPQPLASFQRGMTDGNIFACRAHVGAGLQARGEHELAADNAHIIGPPKAKQSSDNCAIASQPSAAAFANTSSTGIADRSIIAAMASTSSR